MDVNSKILSLLKEEDDLFQPRRIEDRTSITLEKAIARYKELIEYDNELGIIELLAGDNDELDEYTFNCLRAIPEFTIDKHLKGNINYIQQNISTAANVILNLESILQMYFSKEFAKKYNIEPPKIKYP